MDDELFEDIDPTHEFIVAGYELQELLAIGNYEVADQIKGLLNLRYDKELDPKIEIYLSDDCYQVYYDDVVVYEYIGADARFYAANVRIHQIDYHGKDGFLIKTNSGFQFVETDEKPEGFKVRCASESYVGQLPPLVRLKDKCLQN